MNYPSLSLKQDLIDQVFSNKVFSNKDNGVQKELKQTASAESIRRNKYYNRNRKIQYKERKELRQQNVLVEECDQCDYKTTKFQAMYKHKREKHSMVKQRCSDCDYSHVYPNRVKKHYNRVHLGMKVARDRGRIDKCRSDSCEFAGTTSCLELESHKLHKLKCRRESCENAGTTNCLELETHSLFFCEQCQLSFGRVDSLKFHKDKIHEGLVYNCDYCDIQGVVYSTARKNGLKRHIQIQHSDEDFKQNRKPRVCKEEGCTYINLNGGLKPHIETRHEGIVRFKCHVMNCSFGSSWSKDLRRHARTHGKESPKVSVKSEIKLPKNAFMACDQDDCNSKVENVRELKTHIAQTHRGAIKYICQLENCNFETYWNKYLLKHMRRSKHELLKATESVSVEKRQQAKKRARANMSVESLKQPL